MNKTIIFFILFIFIIPFAISAREQAVDLNTYYHFPVSFGVEYQTLSPFGDYGAEFNVWEVSGNIRYPLPFFPVLQPMIEGGLIQFDSRDTVNPERLDHSHFFGAGGLVYSNRFAKSFEIGAEILAGFSQSYFFNMIEGYDMVGSPNIFGQVGLRISLVPSFNFVIDIHPNLKYLYTLGPLKDFNGLIMGVGFSGQYRFGEDPDAPQSLIRSIKFSQVKFPPVFAAMQSYYVKNPLSSITITNTDSRKITDIEVSFFQAGYMDTATPSAAVPGLLPGESAEVDIYASFNQNVFTTEGITPLTGEIIVKYESKGRPAEQKQPVSYELHDKTAVVWDDDRKACAFITPADSALRNYASFIRQACKDTEIPGVSKELQFAMEVFHALGELGVLYQIDPSLPFTSVKGNLMVVDSISLPRATLKRITGDCDDLTVLFCSMLETVGIETAIITIPGHIYMAFNTKIEARSFARVHPERRMTIVFEGELWVPVEITMIGKSDFLSSWRKGIEEYLAMDTNPLERGFYRTKKAQEIYRPVGLKESDLGLQYGNSGNIIQGVNNDLTRLIDTIVREYKIRANQSKDKKDYNKLGIIYAKFSQYRKAEEAFTYALRIDSEFTNPKVNLANILYLKQDYGGALKQYLEVIETLKTKNRQFEKTSSYLDLILNISKSYYKMEKFDKAGEYYKVASGINSEKVEKYGYLDTQNEGEARAAEFSDTRSDIIFAGDEN